MREKRKYTRLSYSKEFPWHAEARALWELPRFRNRPLALAVHLNVPWRFVVDLFAYERKVRRSDYSLKTSYGFEDYGS